MNRRIPNLYSVFSLLLVLFIITCSTVRADPCGMVPPISFEENAPLTRIGVQKTYVFYQDGFETFAIHPGFQGKVGEFGMLIPFPTPPAIRKLPDALFPQIAAAIDPPEVAIDVNFSGFGGGGLGGIRGVGGGGGSAGGLLLDRSEVHVIREQAVGMYEVAVLAAGSADALKKWMDEHGFRYPDGMDEACNDYVEERWCFVAVKAKVGSQRGVDPKPGMRKVDADLPKGASFDGYVQAMGFRFKSRKLVVPMRLSAFNKGELRNIVYLLSEEPSAITDLDTDFVVRQISGEQLYKNLTLPLPLRIYGAKTVGKMRAVLPSGRTVLLNKNFNRNPKPKNGIAAELFASDLASARSGRLNLSFEQGENELSEISERLNLRGSSINDLQRRESQAERKQIVRQDLAALKKMTLTVIDGDFPRDLIAANNLTFFDYRIPANRNSSKMYDAKVMGPAPRKKKKGILKLGALTNPAPERFHQRATVDSLPHQQSRKIPWRLGTMLSCLFVGLAIVVRNRQRR